MPAASDVSGAGVRGEATAAAAAAAAGIVVFALSAHRGGAWVALAALGLLVAAGAIGTTLRSGGDAVLTLGLRARSRGGPAPALIGLALGSAAGALHRWGLGLPPWPAGGAGAFVAVACAVGATEELVFRGWLQGVLRPLGWPAAVALAAVAHAAYKVALFAGPAPAGAIDLPLLAAWTIGGGLVLGLLRQWSASVVPCVLAHAAFDLVVYRDVAHAPWWVWS